uniref:Uncharacterized protein n=1 Tax=Candidatus Kentrum sp. UNK TaxID=2126344 RepID=A0A451A2W1_9GAMM|nr:MAG: hypothetical protein BECKUNK1418G_GA0071005_101123 [Candidatus Kentron sp. UNK]VFK69229.1 MAG: hypothetical protein BECKUNK1418H_GA0071006_101222 [Candidatus Kentron sp. UNK]
MKATAILMASLIAMLGISTAYSEETKHITDPSIIELAKLVGKLEAQNEKMQAAIEKLEKKSTKNSSSIQSIGQKNCSWGGWKQKWDLEITRSCPDGKYAKGIGFKHKNHENGTHQEHVRVYCCSIR